MKTNNILKDVHEHLKDVHEHSSNHKEELQNSEICGCFYCLKMFHNSDIKEWIDKGNTAICPFCGTDSVIGNKELEINDGLLNQMKEYWFDSPENIEELMGELN